jgi:hypothetical protein
MSKNRFDDAVGIQQGASNPSGIARSLLEAVDECLREGLRPSDDAAVRAILHQLSCVVGRSEARDVRSMAQILIRNADARNADEDAEAAMRAVVSAAVEMCDVRSMDEDIDEYDRTMKECRRRSLRHEDATPPPG